MNAIEQIPQLPLPEEKHWQRYLIDSLMAVGGVVDCDRDHLRVPSVPDHSQHFTCLPAAHPAPGNHARALCGDSGSSRCLSRF